MVEETRAALGGLDMLVANAGRGADNQSFLDLPSLVRSLASCARTQSAVWRTPHTLAPSPGARERACLGPARSHRALAHRTSTRRS
jgi:hypothetical protein